MKLHFKKIRLFTFLVISLFFQSCINPLDQEPGEFEDYLVVEGFIDNDYGPHDIIVTRIASFSAVREGGAITTIDADVNVIDQNGVITPVQKQSVLRKDVYNADNTGGCLPATNYVEVRTYHRTPDAFKAAIGNTYILEINIGNKTYRSEPQTILPTPEISSLGLAFKELPGINPLLTESGIEVLATFQDPPNEDNFYSWKVNGTYRINTPQLGNACCLFDPADDGADDCWIIEKNIEGNEIAFSDSQSADQLITTTIGFVQDNGLRFASQQLPNDKLYHIEVEQYAICKEAFEFNSQIKTLSEIDGDIFDPFPQSIRGNIYNIEDPEEIVIGYFGAFSVQKGEIFVSESDLLYKQPFTQPCGDCRVRAGAQTTIPEPYL